MLRVAHRRSGGCAGGWEAPTEWSEDAFEGAGRERRKNEHRSRWKSLYCLVRRPVDSSPTNLHIPELIGAYSYFHFKTGKKKIVEKPHNPIAQAFAIMFSLLLAASSSLIVAVKGGGNGHMGIRHSAGGSDTVILHAQAAGRLA